MTVRANQPALVIRTCVGCREREVKSSLLRLVAVGDDILPDPQARLPGRGAYLHPRQSCLELAQRRRALPRSLRTAGPLGVDALAEYLKQATEQVQIPVGKQVEKLMNAR